MMMDAKAGLRIDAGDVPIVGWENPAHGSIMWQTLLSGDITASSELVCGIAHLRKGDSLALHHHAQAEVYFGLSGRVTVVINGTASELGPDITLYVPPAAVHGFVPAQEDVRFFYAFAANSFSDVTYHFVPPTSPPT